jgi:hypothetical protein
MRMPRIPVELAVALVAVALLLLTAFETARLVTEHAALSSVRASQEPGLAEIAKVRAQLDALAGGTARLAADGNVNARAVVAEMQRQGITLRAPAGGQ